MLIVLLALSAVFLVLAAGTTSPVLIQDPSGYVFFGLLMIISALAIYQTFKQYSTWYPWIEKPSLRFAAAMTVLTGILLFHFCNQSAHSVWIFKPESFRLAVTYFSTKLILLFGLSTGVLLTHIRQRMKARHRGTGVQLINYQA